MLSLGLTGWRWQWGWGSDTVRVPRAGSADFQGALSPRALQRLQGKLGTFTGRDTRGSSMGCWSQGARTLRCPWPVSPSTLTRLFQQGPSPRSEGGNHA